MAASFNKVILMGNLTRDPEVRTTPGGLTIAKLGLAVNRKWRDRQSNEMREETTFVDIDAFGSQAETIQRFCSKGSGLFVEGRLKLDQWQDRDSGQNRSKLGVVLENFQFTGGRGDGEGGGDSGGYEQSSPPRRQSRSSGGGGGRSRQAPAQSSPPPSDEFDDDVPF